MSKEKEKGSIAEKILDELSDRFDIPIGAPKEEVWDAVSNISERLTGNPFVNFRVDPRALDCIAFSFSFPDASTLVLFINSDGNVYRLRAGKITCGAPWMCDFLNQWMNWSAV